jgi:hypothetical protein
MPTKTKQGNKTSPARAIPPQAIEPLAKGLVGGLAGGYSAGIGEVGQIRDEFKEKDFRSQKFGKKLKMLGGAGLRTFGAYQQGMLGGVSQGLLGTDFGLGSMGMLADNNPQAGMPGQAPAATENIAQNSSAGGNPVFNPANENTINSVMGPTDTYGSLFT